MRPSTLRRGSGSRGGPLAGSSSPSRVSSRCCGSARSPAPSPAAACRSPSPTWASRPAPSIRSISRSPSRSIALAGLWLLRPRPSWAGGAAARLAFLVILGLSVLSIFAFEAAAGMAVEAADRDLRRRHDNGRGPPGPRPDRCRPRINSDRGRSRRRPGRVSAAGVASTGEPSRSTSRRVLSRGGPARPCLDRPRSRWVPAPLADASRAIPSWSFLAPNYLVERAPEPAPPSVASTIARADRTLQRRLTLGRHRCGRARRRHKRAGGTSGYAERRTENLTAGPWCGARGQRRAATSKRHPDGP